jgi:hypothetical protein
MLNDMIKAQTQQFGTLGIDQNGAAGFGTAGSGSASIDQMSTQLQNALGGSSGGSGVGSPGGSFGSLGSGSGSFNMQGGSSFGSPGSGSFNMQNGSFGSAGLGSIMQNGMQNGASSLPGSNGGFSSQPTSGAGMGNDAAGLDALLKQAPQGLQQWQQNNDQLRKLLQTP